MYPLCNDSYYCYIEDLKIKSMEELDDLYEQNRLDNCYNALCDAVDNGLISEEEIKDYLFDDSILDAWDNAYNGL